MSGEERNETREKSPGGGADADSHAGEAGRQLKDLLDGTARVGASFGEVFAKMGDIFSGRDHVVMVRVNQMTLDKIDHLVESGMFSSRSESAAYLLAKGINADYELFERISSKVEEINRLREELKSIVDDQKTTEK